MRASVARPGNFRPTVQNKLNRQVHVLHSFLPARDLDPIRERRHRAVRPTRPAILRYVLIQALAEKVVSGNVRPGERFRKIFRGDVRVWRLREYFLLFVVSREHAILVHVSRFGQLQGTSPRGKVVVILKVGFDFQEGTIRSRVDALDQKKGEKRTRREKEQRERRHRPHRF